MGAYVAIEIFTEIHVEASIIFFSRDYSNTLADIQPGRGKTFWEVACDIKVRDRCPVRVHSWSNNPQTDALTFSLHTEHADAHSFLSLASNTADLWNSYMCTFYVGDMCAKPIFIDHYLHYERKELNVKTILSACYIWQ